MTSTGGMDIRALVLEVVDELVRKYDSLQAAGVLQEASRRLPRRDREAERALLTAFYDLFRTGYLSWGHDLPNPSPPFCHVTALGRQALALRSRDPANPDGYLAHLRHRAPLGPITDSYVTEALNTFNAACFKPRLSWSVRLPRVLFLVFAMLLLPDCKRSASQYQQISLTGVSSAS